MPTIFGLTVEAAAATDVVEILVPLIIGLAAVTLRGIVVIIGGTTFAEIFISLPDDVVMSGVWVLCMSIFTVDSAGFDVIFIMCLTSFGVADDISFTTIGDDLTMGFVTGLYDGCLGARGLLTCFWGWTLCN